jgi:hypothetical protein
MTKPSKGQCADHSTPLVSRDRTIEKYNCAGTGGPGVRVHSTASTNSSKMQWSPRTDDDPIRADINPKGVRLRIGAVNVGTMAGRSGEVVEMVGRRKLDFCCVQETRWKGGSARTMGEEGNRYKFFWMGCEEGVAGVGVLVQEKWIEKVIEVKRVSERIIVLRVTVGKCVLNVVSVYAPQVGRTMEEKEEFYVLLGKVMSKIGSGEKLVICGNLNGHVGAKIEGFDGVHGGNGFGDRNLEGEMLLEFAVAKELIVANTWFQKRDTQIISYESGGCSTVIDYILVPKGDRTMIQDVKVIRSEPCIPQHKLMICVMRLKESVRRKKAVFVSKSRIWRLKEEDKQKSFCAMVHDSASGRSKDDDVESTWKKLKDCLLAASDDVCGRTKGPPRHKETWWWNQDTEKVVKEKRRLFLMWQKTGTDEDKEAYCKVNNQAKRVIAKAKAVEREKLGDTLENEDAKGNIFRVAKQMVKKNSDVAGSGCVRDADGSIVVDEEKTMEIWKRYYEKLLNEEFDWNKSNLESASAVSGPSERISTSEVRAAIAKSKSGKAAGPSGVAAEMLKASGEAGIQWVTDICNKVVDEGCIPDDWRKSWMVNVYKGKGDALECGSYRGIKLLDQVLKVLERVIDARVRNKVKIDGMQFGFRSGKGTTDAIFIVRQVQEKFLAKRKELWMAFVDLEKAFDRVPRDVVWWALRHVGVEEWIVNVIKAMYAGATTAVKLPSGISQEFEVKVGVHQGSVLSPLLFIIVMEALSSQFKQGLPWELLYADDLVLLAESEEELKLKIARWKSGMEDKGLRVNIQKTKVMRCQVGTGQVEESGKWSCGVCKKGVGYNSIKCHGCSKWIHKKCSSIVGRLQDVDGSIFQCSTCVSKATKGVNDMIDGRDFILDSTVKLELVDKFCYLGDMIGKGGGVEEASRTRAKCAWGKFNELSPILTLRGASLKLKGKIYKACVQRVLVYGSETWAMKMEDMRRLERAENMMVRWMCGMTLRERKRSEELRARLGIECVAEVVRRGRLRWFGHIERKDKDDWVSSCRELVVDGSRGRGRGRKTWLEGVEEEMRKRKLHREDAQDRQKWRNLLFWKPSNIAQVR